MLFNISRNQQGIVLATALMLTAMLPACSSNSFKSQDTKQSSESKRPSDEGEGVAGYLTDPNGLTFEIDEGEIGVSGGSGAVTAKVGSVVDLVVCLATVRKSEFVQTANAGGQLDAKSITILAQVSPIEDGSFTLRTKVNLIPDDLIAVSVGVDCEKSSKKVEKDSSTLVFRDQAKKDPFESLDLELEQVESTKAGSSKLPEGYLCLEETADCTEKFMLTVIDDDTGKTLPAKVSAYSACKTEAESINIEKECDLLDSIEISSESKIFYYKSDMFLTVFVDGYANWQALLKGDASVTAKLSPIK